MFNGNTSFYSPSAVEESNLTYNFTYAVSECAQAVTIFSNADMA